MSERSAQHSPRVDEEMSGEVEIHVRNTPVDARSDDDLEVVVIDLEAAASDEFEDDRHLELLARSEIARFLRPSALPADAMTIIAIAHEEHATEVVLDELVRLPRGVEFATVGEIWEVLGHETERRGDDTPDAVSEAVDELVDAIAVASSSVDAVPEPVPALVAPASPPVGARPNHPPEAAPERTPHRPAWWSPVGAVSLGLGVVRGVIRVADRAVATVRARVLPRS